MLTLFANIGIGFLAFTFIWICIYIAKPIGEAFYALTAYPMRFGLLGNIYAAFVNGFFKISYLFKIIGYGISALGGLLPILILDNMNPILMSNHGLLWGVFIVSFVVAANIMHRVHLMQTPDFYGIAPYMLALAGVKFENIDKISVMRMARSHFADETLINLLKLVLCYGLAIFSANRLALFGASSRHISPFDGVAGAFNLVKISIGDQYEAAGAWHLIINGFFGLSLLIYTAFYISLSSKLIDEKPVPVE